MQGEQIATAEITEAGVVGDRAYALVETESGKVLSGKTPKLGTQLLGCRAEFVEPPRAGEAAPAVRITLPDGTVVTSHAADANTMLSAFLGRVVTLQRAAPEDFTIDQYHPDVEDLHPDGHRDTITESKLGAALFAELGVPSAVPAGSFLDGFPVSVMTTSTLDHLRALRPESDFDARRFRMNVVVATTEAGFIENGWIGSSVSIGDAVRLAVFLSDPRWSVACTVKVKVPVVFFGVPEMMPVFGFSVEALRQLADLLPLVGRCPAERGERRRVRLTDVRLRQRSGRDHEPAGHART